KKQFYKILSQVKILDGYYSNIKSHVQLKNSKLVNLKSYDYHALMQQLLPIAIRDILLKQLGNTITRLCFFFNALCSKVVDPSVLDTLQHKIVVTLCILEMYLPPVFFDIMVHLSIHLIQEVKLCEPVFLRWMYPFERFIKTLKGCV